MKKLIFTLALALVAMSVSAENTALQKYAMSSPLLKYCPRTGFTLLKADDPTAKALLAEKKKLISVLTYSRGGIPEDDSLVIVSVKEDAGHTTAEKDGERYDFISDFLFYGLGMVDDKVRVFVYAYGTQGPPSMRDLN
jgi:hypothetical protein